jgi:hypothetical protein
MLAVDFSVWVYCVGVNSSILVCWVFIIKWCWICHMLFIYLLQRMYEFCLSFCSVSMLYRINGFVYVEPSFCSGNKSYLVKVYDLFFFFIVLLGGVHCGIIVLFNSVCLHSVWGFLYQSSPWIFACSFHLVHLPDLGI